MRYPGYLLFLTLLMTAGASGIGAAENPLAMSGIRGGIVVHLGCGDGRETADLCPSEAFLVHGLDTDARAAEEARRRLDSIGLYGRASAEHYDGRNLPYGDNIVNLIVVKNGADVAASEVERVLAPRGVAMLPADSRRLEDCGLDLERETAQWASYRKPWPDDIDEWTHYLYDASGNAVTKDKRVRRPRHVQWQAGPKRSRHHDALASMSAMTSSHGRIFYIFDEGPVSIMHRPSRWKLIARDAFNGKLLWKQDIPQWMTHLYNFRAGPKQLPRRLVSVGDSVFVTLGLSAPITQLDAATGEARKTYPGSAKTEEIVLHNNMLLAVVGDPDILIEKSDGAFGYWEMAEYEEPTVEKRIQAWEADTGRPLWSLTGENLEHMAPLSLCARGERVFYLDNENVHCVSATTGEPLWKSPFETEGLFLRAYAPTVVADEGIILCLKWDRLCAWSIQDGKPLWQNKGAMGFGSPGDLFLIGDRIWTVPMTKAIWRESVRDEDGIVRTGIDVPKSTFLSDAKTAVALDPQSGEIVDLLPFAHTQHHHRCYRNKATPDYLLIGHSGIQVVDLDTKSTETHRWVRGLCQYGIMPANGCIYVPPDTCQCYGAGKINGFFALSETNSWAQVKVEPALEKGPAWSCVTGAKDEPAGESPADWPAYRGGFRRSGAARCELPKSPTVKWRRDIGKTITAPVVSEGRVFIADRDAYTVHCLDAASGTPAWKFLANGPVDSPPAIRDGLCLFGCGDGSVYCLEVASGNLAWRFKTSRIERRIGHEDRLESPLRIHGAPLILDDTVYFAAGYSSNLDGGIRLYGLDAPTGALRCQSRLASGCWGDESGWGSLGDILVSDGENINMRSVCLDRELQRIKARGLIVAATGLLEDSWFHRQAWSHENANGQLLVFDGQWTVSAANPYTGLKQQRKNQYKEYNQDGHFHQKFTRYREEFFPVGSVLSATRTGEAKPVWFEETPFQPRAMVLQGNRFCMAGWKDAVVIEAKTGLPKDPANPDPRDSALRLYATDTGEVLYECALESEPVFDGMAAAQGDLFLALRSGAILCLTD